MRRSHVATALVALTAGLTAQAVLRRLGGRRPAAAAAPVAPSTVDDAVVQRFPPRIVAAPPAVAARCGEHGGRTKAGAPCGARAASGGRCRHHPLAA